jgi:hypothetical protein
VHLLGQTQHLLYQKKSEYGFFFSFPDDRKSTIPFAINIHAPGLTTVPKPLNLFPSIKWDSFKTFSARMLGEQL